MERVDSGHETLVSDESPCDLLTPTSPTRSSRGVPTSEPSRPPRITPFSGVPCKGKVLIRPIAFKPIMTSTSTTLTSASRFSNAGERYGSTPILARPGSQLTLYGSSSDLRHHHGVNSNHSLDRKLLSSPPLAMASLTSLPLAATRKMAAYDSLESVRKSPLSNSFQYHSHSSHSNHSKYRLIGDDLDSTPSPSDSGAAEMEAALRDRDAELAYLRQTMEHNEHVIFRVYQEKERVWDRELRRMKSAHENRLRAAAQKALKLEQMLMMQTYQLQQDKKYLKVEAERACQEVGDLRQEVDLLRGRLEETEWGLCQKTGELSLLKTQLKEAQIEQTSKTQDAAQLRSQLRELQAASELRDADLSRSRRDLEERDKELLLTRAEVHRVVHEHEEVVNHMRERHAQELADVKAELPNKRWAGEWTQHEADEEVARLAVTVAAMSEAAEEARKVFERERLVWAQEKEKVLRYQRQLQYNYVQMFRRTRALEGEVDLLSNAQDARCLKKQLPAIEMGQTIEL